MTLAEIMAGVRAGQSIGQAQSFTNLTGTAADERRALADARRQLEEQQKERERQAAGQERKRGRGRLLGGLLGAGLAFATGGTSLALGAGAGLGSFLGQKAVGHLSLDDVSSGLGGGMFFGGAREDISGAERDVNRFLSEAEDNFKQKQFTSAIGDAITGYKAGNFLSNIGGELSKDAVKDKFSFKDLFSKKEDAVDPLMEVAEKLKMPNLDLIGRPRISVGDISNNLGINSSNAFKIPELNPYNLGIRRMG